MRQLSLWSLVGAMIIWAGVAQAALFRNLDFEESISPANNVPPLHLAADLMPPWETRYQEVPPHPDVVSLAAGNVG